MKPTLYKCIFCNEILVNDNSGKDKEHKCFKRKLFRLKVKKKYLESLEKAKKKSESLDTYFERVLKLEGTGVRVKIRVV